MIYSKHEKNEEKPYSGIFAQNSSTISRDIDFMKCQLNAPIEYSALHRGHYCTEPNYRIPVGFSSAEDLLALGMAKSILSLYRDTPLCKSAQHLLDSITALLAGEGNSDWPSRWNRKRWLRTGVGILGK